MYNQQRLNALVHLGDYILNEMEEFDPVIQKAGIENPWFTEEFCKKALLNIARQFLNKSHLENWINHYKPADSNKTKNIGIVMAGNIPAVGFYDWLCVFLSGHRAHVKPSSKDKVLILSLIEKIGNWYMEEDTVFREQIAGCDAYIATGSNNSSRYFEYYFGKYPSVIRKNRSSVAIITGNENTEHLDLLADDMLSYFGMGCRNVTQLYVPANYNFEALIQALKKFNHFADHNKYKNNYDYQLALLILNKRYYMSTEGILLTEGDHVFAPISLAHYAFYSNLDSLVSVLKQNENIQCICGDGFIPFGQSQIPSLHDYADGVDVMAWLTNL